MNRSFFTEFKTPCFILDKAELTRSIEGFHAALRERFSSHILGYSVKTNSLPYALSVARSLGCYAEVVSSDEYDLALLCGYSRDHIIYNGPIKSYDSFIESIKGGAIVNIETHRELEWLRYLPTDGVFKIGIRLNMNLSIVSPKDACGDNDNSRFGFSDDTDEFSRALDYIKSMENIQLAGLHIHRTTHDRSVLFYKNSISYACNIIRKYNLCLQYLDIGGGYFGIFEDKPSYDDYSSCFRETLDYFNLQNLQIVIEPGNALVASCFSFLSEVIDVKHVEEDRWFVTTDGSRNDIDPFFKKTRYLYDLFGMGVGEPVREQIVSGCTCLEYDRLFSITNHPLLKEGDRILYKNVGAYTMSLTPLFIRYLPRVYVLDEGKTQVIRDQWTAKECINKSVIQ